MKIHSDTPEELIQLIQMIDWSKMTDKKLRDWAGQLKQSALQFGIPTKKLEANANMIEVNIPGCPQIAVDFISKFDLSGVPKAKMTVAFTIAKAQLKNFVHVI